MEEQDDILELKFDGGGINPAIVKPSEIAQLVDSFERAIVAVIQQYNPEINTDAVLFSFDTINNESLDLRFTLRKVNSIVVSSYLLITTSISTGDYSKLDNTAISSLRVFPKFSKKYDCIGYFNRNKETLTTFNANTDISLNKSRTIKGETTIYGQLIDAGGEKPNVHIKINGDYILIFDTSELNAKKLAQKLYEKVGLTGLATWDADTYEILSFKLNDILDYSPGNTSKAINQLKGISSGFWDKFDTNDDINNQLLRD